MKTQVMTLGPEAVRDTPAGESVWEKALIAFVRDASAQGQTIVVSTEIATLIPEQVARGLNLSRSTVSRRIADGTITSVKIGNRHHVPYPEYRRLWDESMSAAVVASMDDIEAELFDDEG
jgi:excisionase family DNA binding protein